MKVKICKRRRRKKETEIVLRFDFASLFYFFLLSAFFFIQREKEFNQKRLEKLKVGHLKLDLSSSTQRKKNTINPENYSIIEK